MITIAAAIAELSGYNLRELGRLGSPKNLVLESIGTSSLQGSNEGHVAFALSFIDHPSSVNLPLAVRNPTTERVANLAITLVINSEYVHVLPEASSSQVVRMGSVDKSDRTRTTNHAGTLSSATTFIRGLNAGAKMLVGEPLVWTHAYLKHLAAGNAPTVDLDVRISADGVAKSSFKLRLQAVREIPLGAKGFGYAPAPFVDVSGRIIMVSSKMGINEYQGRSIYVADGLSTKDAIFTRP